MSPEWIVTLMVILSNVIQRKKETNNEDFFLKRLKKNPKVTILFSMQIIA